MLRRAAVLGFAALLAGCTQEIVLQDMPDGGNRDAAGVKDARFGDDAWCAAYAQVAYRPRVAQFLIALDRSSAMQGAFGGTTRKAATESALAGAVAKYQTTIEFGFEQFPADSTDKNYGDCQRNTCCAGSVKIEPKTLNAFPSISGPLQCGGSGFPCPSASDETASYAALQKIRDFYIDKYPLSGDDHYVLLVTASEPYCSTLNDSSDACDRAMSAAYDLGELGIRVIVVSVGYQVTPSSCLLQISQTGSSLSPPPGTSTLYQPMTPSQLNNDISGLIAAVAKTACTSTMDSYGTPPPYGAQATVSAGSMIFAPADSTAKSSWSFANPARTSIILSGDACESYVNSQAGKLTLGYPCSTCGGSPACPWL